MTTILASNTFRNHNTGDHPEKPARLLAIDQALEKVMTNHETPLTLHSLADLEASDLDESLLRLVHTPEQISLAKDLCLQGGGFLDADTKTSPQSFQVALLAAHTAAKAVDMVLTGQDKNVLCFLRPPGHHATQNKSMGFCLFNNIALAARHAQKTHGIGRILIVDWDVHHGNGTQDIFYNDDSVTFLSIHRYPFYPGSGDTTETGTGRGLGATINIPVEFGTPRARYLDLFQAGLEKAAANARPEFVLLSAGFDAHHLDPVGNLGLETADYTSMTRMVQEIANTYCGGSLVSCLEGGYHLQALADSAMAHVTQLNSLKL
jgi:acetoin utilization deacetylase AcuC-like enzyme